MSRMINSVLAGVFFVFMTICFSANAFAGINATYRQVSDLLVLRVVDFGDSVVPNFSRITLDRAPESRTFSVFEFEDLDRERTYSYNLSECTDNNGRFLNGTVDVVIRNYSDLNMSPEVTFVHSIASRASDHNEPISIRSISYQRVNANNEVSRTTILDLEHQTVIER